MAGCKSMASSFCAKSDLDEPYTIAKVRHKKASYQPVLLRDIVMTGGSENLE
jgi:hypothetical protein